MTFDTPYAPVHRLCYVRPRKGDRLLASIFIDGECLAFMT